MSEIRARGGCLCGGVRYTVTGPLREGLACHCSQCRRTSGHFVVATSAANADLQLEDTGTLRWYASSARAERGFCCRCGGNLFWRATGSATTSIMMGSLDPPTGLRIARRIFVADKADYYAIDDGIPRDAGWQAGG